MENCGFIIFVSIYNKERENMDKKLAAFNRKAKIEKEKMSFYHRYKLNNGENINLNFVDDQYSAYDAFILTGSCESIVEVKVRSQYTFEKIKSMNGPILEFNKMAGIQESLQKNDIDYESFFYFNFFADELKIYNIPINPYMFTWQSRYLQKNDFDKTKIWKQVTFLDDTFLVETIKL